MIEIIAITLIPTVSLAVLLLVIWFISYGDKILTRVTFNRKQRDALYNQQQEIERLKRRIENLEAIVARGHS